MSGRIDDRELMEKPIIEVSQANPLPVVESSLSALPRSGLLVDPRARQPCVLQTQRAVWLSAVESRHVHHVLSSPHLYGFRQRPGLAHSI